MKKNYYYETIEIIEKLNMFIDGCEKSIIQAQMAYTKAHKELEKKQSKENEEIESEYNAKRERIKRNSSKLIIDAKRIKEDIDKMDEYLTTVDKYYLKSKKKWRGLGGARLYKFDDYGDYFTVLEQLKKDFEKLSRKYSEEILPSILNGINYFFSEQRKADYEQLILLHNTVNDFSQEIQQVIPDIEVNEIEAIDKQYMIQAREYQQKCSFEYDMCENRYADAMNALAENIDNDLEAILSDKNVFEMFDLLEYFKEKLIHINTKELRLEEPVFVGYVEYPINEYISSKVLANFVSTKYEKLVNNNVLKLPITWNLLNYKTLYLNNADSNEITKKQFVQSIMYSWLAMLPMSKIKFTIVDCEAHGNDVEDFFPVKKIVPELFGEKVYTDYIEASEYLKKLNNEIEDCIQNKLSSKSNTIFDDERMSFSKKIELVVLFDFPKGLDERILSIIKNIDERGAKCGVYLIVVESTYFIKNVNSIEKLEMVKKIKNNSIQIFQSGKELRLFGLNFSYYDSLDYSALLKNVQEYKNATECEKNNEYYSLYPVRGLDNYTKEYKNIEIPFALDEDGVVHNLSLENENFATYLMGASRSGKSTLIHTMIASIVQNYHPDMVELWLADFKQLEFKRYIQHRPPHVKYILLDESEELVFDLIDRLTDVMLERQRLFGVMKNKNEESVNKITDVNYKELKRPMPVILVILDEFSIMSQAIQRQSSGEYKLKMQNLLAKGGGLGIKFVFASQTYRNGIGGLSTVAKEQIQQRIAMKASSDEITEVLDLSVRLKTEQVKIWIESLQPHYALIKTRVGMDAPPIVKRLWVLYINKYTQLENYIDTINETMRQTEEYRADSVKEYVDKHAVVVDGNTFEAFDKNKIVNELQYLYDTSNDLNGDEIILYLGRPRLMREMKGVVLTPESRQNILLIANSGERHCAASIISSAIYSMQCQNREVEIWSYERNSLYRNYKDTEWKNMKIVSRMEDICKAISDCKEELNNHMVKKDKLIIMLGFERLCTEFSYLGPQKTKSANVKMASVEERNISQEIIDQIFKFDEDDIFDDITLDDEDIYRLKLETNIEKEYDADELLYDASMDLIEIIKNGSRQGIHFMACVNSFADLSLLKVRVDEFGHRIAFRIPKEEVAYIFPTGSAESVSSLPEHVCAYTDNVNKYSLRPYLFKNITWDDWYINSNGKAEKDYI